MPVGEMERMKGRRREGDVRTAERELEEEKKGVQTIRRVLDKATV